MKPIITWVVVANARSAKVFTNSGPGRGLAPCEGLTWDAAEPDLPRSKAGVGHSIAGHGTSAVEQSNRQDIADAQFAKDIVGHLSQAHSAKTFNRLVFIAGPHMLGLLRRNLSGPLLASVVGQIDKDLAAHGVDEIAAHVAELIAL